MKSALITDKQYRSRLDTTRNLLKMLPKYKRKQFSCILTGGKTRVHLKPLDHTICLPKYCLRRLIAKGSISAKKAMFIIFFDIRGSVMQQLLPIKKAATGKFYRKKVLRKLKNTCLKRQPNTGFKHLAKLRDNAPVTSFLT